VKKQKQQSTPGWTSNKDGEDSEQPLETLTVQQSFFETKKQQQSTW